MDRPISSAEHRRRRFKWIFGAVLTVLALFGGARLIAMLMRPTLERDDFATTRVERGPVAAAIETAGLLAPEREIALAAPADTRVLRVIRKPGSHVRAGDPILQLDTAALELERETLAQQLAAKENAKRQAALRHEKQTNEDRGKLELIALDLRYMDARHRQQRQLFDQGLTSMEELQQAELQLEKKKVEQRQLEDAQRDGEAAQEAEQQGLDLEIALLRKSMARAEDRLARAAAYAPSDGVVTWVVEAEGSSVRSGEPLARIADLSRFKVSATISDFYAGRINEGQHATIRVGDAKLPGRVIRLLPEVTNGVISFEAIFEHRDDLVLRPNQRVDVYLRTARRDSVLRVRRGPAIPGPGRHDVFVIRGGSAVRTRIEAGVTGPDYAEIISGLAEGDEVILTQLERYAHLSNIPIN